MNIKDNILNFSFKIYFFAALFVIICAVYIFIPFNEISKNYLSERLKKKNAVLKNAKLSLDILKPALNIDDYVFLFEKENINISAQKTKIKIADIFNAEKRVLNINFSNAIIKNKFGELKISNGKIIYNIKNNKIKLYADDLEIKEHTGWTDISAIYMFGKVMPGFFQKELLAEIEIDSQRGKISIPRLNSIGAVNIKMTGFFEPSLNKLTAELKISDAMIIENQDYFNQLTLYHKRLNFNKPLLLIIDTPDITDLKKMILKN